MLDAKLWEHRAAQCVLGEKRRLPAPPARCRAALAGRRHRRPGWRALWPEQRSALPARPAFTTCQPSPVCTARRHPSAATVTQPDEVQDTLLNALASNLGDVHAFHQLADADCRAVLLGGELLHLLEWRAARAGSEPQAGAALAAGLLALEQCWDVVPADAVAEALAQVGGSG